ncbi:unnamed protein product, partial [Iphiclides podalirius]
MYKGGGGGGGGVPLSSGPVVVQPELGQTTPPPSPTPSALPHPIGAAAPAPRVSVANDAGSNPETVPRGEDVAPGMRKRETKIGKTNYLMDMDGLK